LLDTTVDLATVLVAQGRPAEALKESDAAIGDCARTRSRSSYLIDLHNLRGQALLALGRQEAAIAAHQDALRLHAEMSAGTATSSGDTMPSELGKSTALQGIGAARLASRQSVAAIESLEQALALRVPGEIASELRADTLLLLARAYAEPGARRSPRRSCELGQEAVKGYRAAGELARKELPEALRFLGEAHCQSS
jgi:tetratricopeptide (TPR) repeat protein